MRVASYVKDIDKAIAFVNTLNAKGYETTINIMAVSHARERELDEALAQVLVFSWKFIKPAGYFEVVYLLKEEIVSTAESWSFRDFKSELQEYTQNKWFCTPSYKVVKELGPDHAKEFEVTVVINSKVKGQGLGKNKKGAEQAAAKMAMESFLSISKPDEWFLVCSFS